nr:nuclear RNA export factor 5 [Vicugna pacos]
MLTSFSFPQDGKELPPPIIIDIDTPYAVKPCKENYNGSEMLKNLILTFLQQYYMIYDSGDRHGLLSAYHHRAYFSLTIPFNPEDPAPSSLWEYVKDSRNMKKLKDPYLRVQLLKHTKRDIVHSLCLLPKTQHVFVIEVEGRSQGSVRAFTRTFISIPASYSSLFIVNDELFVRDTSLNKTLSTFSISVPTPSASSMPTLSQEQQQMVQDFSTQSEMNLQWSQKCLQDNDWNYTRAGQVFTKFKAEGKIPEEAFKQIP